MAPQAPAAAPVERYWGGGPWLTAPAALAQPLTISTHHTTQALQAGREPRGEGHTRVFPFPQQSHEGPSCSSSDYCGQPALLLSPDLGLEAVGASPVSAALRELLGLTAALRVP